MKIEEEDWRCFRLIDREVYLGWPLPIAISRGGMGLLEGGWIFFLFLFFFWFLDWQEKRRRVEIYLRIALGIAYSFFFFFLFLLIKVSKVISNFSKIKIKMQWKLELNGIMLFFDEETAVRDPRHTDLDKSFHPSRVGTSRRPC